MWLNGEPEECGSRSTAELVGAVSLSVEEGRVTRIYSIANPDKLARLDEEMVLTR